MGSKYFVSSEVSVFGIGLLNSSILLKGFGLVRKDYLMILSSFMLVIWASDECGNEYINYFPPSGVEILK